MSDQTLTNGHPPVEDNLDSKSMDDVWPIGKKKAYYALAVIFTLGVFDFLDRQILAAVFPYLKAEYTLTDTELGLLVSIVNVAIAILVIPSGYLIDKWSRTKMLCLMSVVWSLATGACAFAGTYSHLMVARFFVGFGEAGYNPAANSLLTVSFPRRLRATVIAIVQSSAALGVPMGLVLGAIIAEHWGWRHAFGVVAIPGLLVSFLALYIKDFKNAPTAKEEAATAEAAGHAAPAKRTNYLQEVWGLLKTPSMLLIYISSASALMYGTASMNWMPTFFNREVGMPMTQASAVVAGSMILGTVFVVLSGPFLDWLRRRNLMNAIYWQAFASFVQFGLCFMVFYGAPTGSMLQIVCMYLQCLTGCTLTPLCFTMVADLTHPNQRATAISLVITLQNVFGMALGPLLTGIISDNFNLSIAMLIMSAFYILVGISFLIMIYTYPRDLAKVGDTNASF